MDPFDIENYRFELPPELIAQEPLPHRDQSRLMLVKRNNGTIEHHRFHELPQLLKPSDLIVLNNTKVIPARLLGKKETGGRVELIILNTHDQGLSSNRKWCLTRSSKAIKKGARILFDDNYSGIVEDVAPGGMAKIKFAGDMEFLEFLEKRGIIPLPPYIKRSKDAITHDIDRERYQTVFSKKLGAIAAPTAGLHFSEKLLKKLSREGIETVEITLHVGYGTFKPIRTKDIRRHKIDPEIYEIDENASNTINKAKRENRRVISVGTTVVRALETRADEQKVIHPGKGITDLYIIPGYKFRVVDAMITNFHLPGSSLLFLVCAFGGYELIMGAYQRAIRERYRFYSYGDAMLII